MPSEKKMDWLTVKQTKQNRKQMQPLCQSQENPEIVSE